MRSEPFHLYAPYRRAEALAALGASGALRTLCDGQWVILPDAVLCFAELGSAPPHPYLASGSRFVWVAARPYAAAPDGCPFLPQEVRAGYEPARPLHLFARSRPTEPFLYLGTLSPTQTYGYEQVPSQGTATFELTPVLPGEVWHALGGPVPAADGGASLDNLFARLRGPTSAHTHLGVLKDFVERWHGPLRPEDGYPEEALRGRQLPPPLRAWLRLGGRRPELLSARNHLFGPEELVPDAEGYLLFYAEQQWLYLWATRTDDVDPPVFGREHETQPWTPEGMTLSEFLLQAALFEAIMSAPYGASVTEASEAVVQRALTPLAPLPLAPWHWPSFPARFFTGNAVLALTCPSADSTDLWLAARSPGPLTYLRPLVDDSWDRSDL